MNLIAIETSTSWLSLAVSHGGAILSRHILAEQRHAEIALDELRSLMQEAGLAMEEVEGVAFGEGPGAFTGLRIACGMAQGLALGRNVPVLGIGTLLAVAEESGGERVLVCLDARMGEVYHAAYVRKGTQWQETSAPGLCDPAAVPLPQGAGWLGAGSGFSVHEKVLGERLGECITALRAEVTPTAAAILRLALPRMERGEGGNAALALPIYLRDKVALKTSERR